MAATIDDVLKELRDFKQTSSDIKSFKEQTSSDIGWLKEQIRSNCDKLDAIKENTGILPQMYEMVQANGRGIEKLAERVDKLESGRY